MNWKTIFSIILGIVVVLGIIAVWNPSTDSTGAAVSSWKGITAKDTQKNLVVIRETKPTSNLTLNAAYVPAVKYFGKFNNALSLVEALKVRNHALLNNTCERVYINTRVPHSSEDEEHTGQFVQQAYYSYPGTAICDLDFINKECAGTIVSHRVYQNLPNGVYNDESSTFLIYEPATSSSLFNCTSGIGESEGAYVHYSADWTELSSGNTYLDPAELEEMSSDYLIAASNLVVGFVCC